ncbi:hypothetical protein F4825DRAFT_329735 [Nemania diffusa]|nr:hypothetical protein F4825DRAFT_329735 [Nemania diffusa]
MTVFELAWTARVLLIQYNILLACQAYSLLCRLVQHPVHLPSVRTVRIYRAILTYLLSSIDIVTIHVSVACTRAWKLPMHLDFFKGLAFSPPW